MGKCYLDDDENNENFLRILLFTSECYIVEHLCYSKKPMSVFSKTV